MTRLSALAAVLLLGACTVGPDHAAPKLALASAYQAAGEVASETADADWWAGFRDPVLSALLARAVEGNTSLAVAEARIQQSRAGAEAAGAALLPELDATSGVDTVSQSRKTPFGAASGLLGLPRGYTQYAVGTQASWEIDLFGGLRRGREAARADLGASEADLGVVHIAVQAETADAYLVLRSLQARLAIAEAEEVNETRFVALVRQRVENDVAPDRDLNRATAELERVRATVPPLRAAIAAQLNRIDVLLGDAPGTHRAELEAARPIPAAPLPAGASVPSELLRRRPDVVAAERRLAASDARIGAAMADYYPHLSLGGLLGVAGIGTGGLFTGEAVQASAGAGLRWRLFDFGRVDAEVAAARGKRAEALALWRGAALSAAEDVETALVRISETRQESEAQARRITALDRAHGQALDAYQAGTASLLVALDADRALLEAKDRKALVDGEQARAAVAAYRALGGGWRPDSPRLAAASGEVR